MSLCRCDCQWFVARNDLTCQSRYAGKSSCSYSSKEGGGGGGSKAAMVGVNESSVTNVAYRREEERK